MGEKKILNALQSTRLCEQLKKIRSVYSKLEKDQKRFCDSFCIHCKDGCGSCCEHFVPDVTRAEAEYLAFGLISVGADSFVLAHLHTRDLSSPFCPLYDPENSAHHCTVYRWRPLICRLFGAAASEDKSGDPVFRNCKWNDSGKSLSSSDLKSHPKDVVRMRDYGLMIEGTTDRPGETELLPIALEQAILRVRLMLELEEESKKGV